MSGSSELDRLFPEQLCTAAIGELSAWTSVQAILAAARYVEGRPVPDDQLEPMLVVPVDDDDRFLKAIIEVAIGWLIRGYRVPEAKVALARAVDRKVSDDTALKLASMRFRPTVELGRPGMISQLPPEKSFFLVKDDPAVIEMIHAPLICMTEQLFRYNETARKMAAILDNNAEKTGGRGNIIHRPYGDSRLPSILEALCFYMHKLEFGPVWGEAGKCNIEMSYRAVNVHGVPPIDPRMLDMARESMEKMLESLR